MSADPHLVMRERPLSKAIVAAIFALSLLMIIGLWVMPRGPFVVVIAYPGDTPQQALSLIASADGMFVAGGRVPWIMLAYSDAKDFPTRLMNAGAMLVLNGAVSSICKQDI